MSHGFGPGQQPWQPPPGNVPPGSQPSYPGWPGNPVVPAGPPTPVPPPAGLIPSAQPRRQRPRPTRGWRRVLLAATLGLINPGLSAAERAETSYRASIQIPLRGSRKVGVLGKGGVGKTTVAATVGSLLALLRPNDRVVAVDADTGFGRLASRIDPYTMTSYWDIAGDRNLQSFDELRRRIGTNGVGLYVLAGQSAAGARHVLDPAVYREAALRLDRHFAISIIDCGSTMDAPVTQEALRDLDALLVVSSPWADGAGAAAKTLEWLAHRGQERLLRNTVVVLNDSDGHADKHTRTALSEQFLRHGQAVVEVPFDPHLRPGGVIDVTGEMSPRVRTKFLEITAIVAQHFAARPAGPPA